MERNVRERPRCPEGREWTSNLNYIVFDLEWNMGYPQTPEQKINEIIEIGAVKVTDFGPGGQVADSFSEFVRPTIHHAIHHFVRKKLPFTKEELMRAEPFRAVIARFRAWCGEDARFISWGPSDMVNLRENLAHYHLDEEWVSDAYDLQAALGYLTEDYNRQLALESACEQFGISAEGEFHDAGTDARCTALVGLAMREKYGPLPPWQDIVDKKEELRQAHARAVEEKLRQDCMELLQSSPRYEEAAFGAYTDPGECFRDRMLNRVLCPECERRMGCGKWVDFPGGYMCRVSCPEHGKFYPVLQMGKKSGNGDFSVNRFLLGQSPKMKTVYFRALEHATPRGAHKKRS